VHKSMWGIALASTVFSGIMAGSLIVRADDTPTTEPAKHVGIKLEKPYSEMTDLTDDEKSKILEIHHKALADMKAIKDKEDVDVRAVLTDDQKAELDKVVAETRQKREEKQAERMKKKDGAATQPAGG
jgi:Spy/CpxP family protein refolding chaperone